MDIIQRLKNRTLLVCGGCGFMGSNFIHYLLAQEPRIKVINVDLLTYAGNPDNLRGVPKERYRFVKGDICDVALMKKLMSEAGAVLNFAAETHVDRSIHGEFKNFFHTNIQGVYSLLEALKASPHIEKMIHVSTDEVWGDLSLASHARFTERSPFRPNSPYAASKAAGDLLIRAYGKTYGLPVIISHSVNFFGPRQFPEKLIPFFALRATADQPLPLYGAGRNIREWLHVFDYARALRVLLLRGKTGESYLASSGEGESNINIAKMILKILGKPENLIKFVADRPGHDRKYALNASKLRSLGWRPRYSIKRDLRETIQWYIENADWTKHAVARSRSINAHIKVK